MLRNNIILNWREIYSIGETIKNQNFRNSKHCWHKTAIIEHPKTSHKLSKTIRQAEKVSQVGFGKSSNNKTKEKFLNEKMQE